MKGKTVSLLGILAVLVFLGIGSDGRAASGQYALYLPIVVRAGSWQEVGAGSASGGGISNVGGSVYPSLALSPNGTPYVAWQAYSNGAEEIHVRFWNGATWAEVGAGSATGGGISNNAGKSWQPSIAISPTGTPYVAWFDDTAGDWEIYVRAWSGSSWATVGTGSASGGGISNNSGDSYEPKIAIAPDGTPYIAWWDEGAVYVRAWNGSIWAEVGVGSATGTGIGGGAFVDIAIAPDGTPYIAWGLGEIYIKSWNGSSWVEVGTGSASGGGISNNAGNSWHVAVGVDFGGLPYVAWQDDTSGDDEIYVRHWDGGSWVDLGGSATSGGISNNSGFSWYPAVAVGSNGDPYVTWFDQSSGNWEIYIKHWNGGSWSDVGAGSSSGGGISNNPGTSSVPSIAISSNGIPYVAWDDSSGGTTEIYILRYTD